MNFSFSKRNELEYI